MSRITTAARGWAMSGEFRRDDAYDCDVLVVGGGLVGLVASMFLAQQGLRVWVVERHAPTSSHPKLRGVSSQRRGRLKDRGKTAPIGASRSADRTALLPKHPDRRAMDLARRHDQGVRE
jgi:2-polyprenyl-6-methoxyphenol hydroxylase-like FAD-dependent oxidoreductase